MRLRYVSPRSKVHNRTGLIHARKIVTVTAEDDQFQLVIDGEMIGALPRTTTREVHRFKAHAGHSAPP
jgi:diacylglycerol kinase family enzyme